MFNLLLLVDQCGQFWTVALEYVCLEEMQGEDKGCASKFTSAIETGWVLVCASIPDYQCFTR